MIINFSPVRSDNILTVIKRGDVLEINGLEFDFSRLPDGASLPVDAIECQWFDPHSNIERIASELQLTLILPHGTNPTKSVAFPESIAITKDGEVEIPK